MCGTWEDFTKGVLGNRLLRIFGSTKEEVIRNWRKLHNMKKLHNL
jgi:hypothetical protein